MKFFVTGGRGQLGSALARAISAGSFVGTDLPELDVRDAEAVRSAIRSARPDVVIHCAAMTDVDGCAKDPGLAQEINANGTMHVALGAAAARASLVYVSTNEVFDGTLERPYDETDLPKPVNAYGRSKLEGEIAAARHHGACWIVRTAWVYAPGGNHFVTKILRAADQRGRLSVVTDEIGSPTYAPDLAQGIVRLIDTGAFGVYHLTNAGVCSRYEFAGEILRLTGRAHVPIIPITSDQYQRASRPPLYTALRNFCGAALGITLRSWQDALQEYLNDVAAC